MNACFAAFLDQSFFQSLIANSIASAFAVVLGIPVGLYLHHRISSRGNKRNRTALNLALKRAIEHNLGTFATIRAGLAVNAVPTFTLDLALLDATAHTKYEVLDDIPLCVSIDHLRFEMAHLDRLLNEI